MALITKNSKFQTIQVQILHNIAIAVKRNEPLVDNDQGDHRDDKPQIPPFNGQQGGRGIRFHFAESFFA